MTEVRLPEPLQAVIFDMDGLLLDTEQIYRVAIFEVCRGLGYEMTEPLMLSMIGMPWDRNRSQLAEAFGTAFPLDTYLDGCRARFQALCGETMPLRPGARELLEHLQASGLPRAVATSTGRGSAEDHLRRAGVRDDFQAVVTRSDVTHGKPHPETFLKAAAALGVEPRSCLALEDSHNGVRAAHAAGMATIMVPDLLEATEEIRALCIAVLPSLVEVRRRLERSAPSVRVR